MIVIPSPESGLPRPMSSAIREASRLVAKGSMSSSWAPTRSSIIAPKMFFSAQKRSPAIEESTPSSIASAPATGLTI